MASEAMNLLNRVPRVAWFVVVALVLVALLFLAGVLYVQGGEVSEGTVQRGTPTTGP